jgi:hypothetical protein
LRCQAFLASYCSTLLHLHTQIKYPENFFLLRGNHECASINRIYGFYDECKRRYSIRLWRNFTDCFNCLPVAALIDEKVSQAVGVCWERQQPASTIAAAGTGTAGEAPPRRRRWGSFCSISRRSLAQLQRLLLRDFITQHAVPFLQLSSNSCFLNLLLLLPLLCCACS